MIKRHIVDTASTANQNCVTLFSLERLRKMRSLVYITQYVWARFPYFWDVVELESLIKRKTPLITLNSGTLSYKLDLELTNNSLLQPIFMTQEDNRVIQWAHAGAQWCSAFCPAVLSIFHCLGQWYCVTNCLCQLCSYLTKMLCEAEAKHTSDSSELLWPPCNTWQ